jgi:hypothetical protein
METMPDKFVRLYIDADVWNEFRAQALMKGETAQAALATLVTETVQTRRNDGAKDRDRGNARPARASNKA